MDWKIVAKKSGKAFLIGAIAGIITSIQNGINLSDAPEVIIIGLIVGALTGGANALKNWEK